MNDKIYNILLPHKAYLYHVYDCIDKSVMFSDPHRTVLNLMAEGYLMLPDKKPIDWGCSSCAREAVRVITIEFVNYDKTK